jgi:hypothetical protein
MDRAFTEKVPVIDEPKPESWWRGFAKFQRTLLYAAVPMLVTGILGLLLEVYLPDLGVYSILPLVLIVTIIVTVATVRGLLRVFRPDDPKDLSLR